MISLAKAAWRGADFAPGHTIKTGPLDGRPATRLTALLVARDPALARIGAVELLLLVGVEGAVRERALVEGFDAVVAGLDPALVTRP